MPPAQSRKAPVTTAAPAVQAPTAAGRSPQDRVGNAGLQDRLGASAALPEEIDLQSAGLAFTLPGPVSLTDDWNQLGTTAPTNTWVTVSQRELRVAFHPALLLDAQWPLSNVAISGFTWDFVQGRMKRVDLDDTQFAIPISGRVDSAIREFAMGLVKGTPLGRPGYDPLADGDVAGTLRKVQGNFKPTGGGKKAPIAGEEVTDFSLSASVRVKKAIEVGAGKSGLSIPAGASMDLSAAVDGNGATFGKSVPNVQSLYLGSSGITLHKDGKPIALLRGMTVARGGAVDVTSFEPLGKLAEVGAGESLIRLLGVFAALNGADPRLAGNGDLSPRVVNAVAEAEMEKGFTDVVRQLIREHHDVIPGLDLRSLLGVEPKA